MSVHDKLNSKFPDTVFSPLCHPDKHPAFNYKGFHPGNVQKLPRGHVKQRGFQAFPVDVTWEQDQGIPMRDGVTLYCDIFRPTNENQVPAIIPWSPYGKASTGSQTYDIMGPWRMGIPYQHLSGYETFEGPNPAEWCSRGYAVVDIDARGSGHSEGNLMFWGEQEATDIYDSISWIAKQPWCNGSVVMMGNSWLAISQINFASRFTHPNLKAIAPWEGLTDVYTQQACRGGIPKHGFGDMVIRGFAGFGKAENLEAMVQQRPLFDEFWDEKKIKPENICDIPIYLTASYSTGLHCEGSFKTFELAKTSRKWLRVHASQEWHDLYRVEATDDLQRFFDFYSKDIPNGWETDTPRVRLTLLGYDGSYARTVEERPELSWPPQSQQISRHYLDAASNSLRLQNPETSSSTAHEAFSLSDSSDFLFHFDKYTELCGRPYAKLYVSCDEADDMEIFVQIRKVSSKGELLESLNWHPMPKPQLEVPNTNVAKHLGQQVYDHTCREPIPAGTIVPLLIPIWPVGIVLEAGEGIMLRISGHDMALPEVDFLIPTEPVGANRGKHTIHTGGDFESYLSLPFIN
ncbi:hypothetical protein N7454_005822 [Penicillium verhagenii]|nr:hypothetical protein N7454_005822 [Penicillium verhagenii]